MTPFCTLHNQHPHTIAHGTLYFNGMAWYETYMKIFRKLIRDKMPEIYAKEGKTLTTRTLTDDAEYFEWLRRKLIEELQEMTEEGVTDEFLKGRFAYLDEVTALMRDVKGFRASEIETIKQRIIAERGSFTKRLLLEP